LDTNKTPATKAASDAQLIARAQRGDEEAFTALFEAHKRRVYSLCLRMTGNTAEAEDLAQEAFLQLYRKISTFRGESAFSTWLHRLAVNVVLMHLRKKGLQQISLDESDTSQDEPVKRDYGGDDRRLTGSVDRIGLQKAIADGTAEHIGNLIVFVAFHVVQDENKPVSGRQIFYRALKRDAVDGTGKNQIPFPDIFARAVFLRRLKRFFKRYLRQPFLPEVHEHHID
jgi:RNA polymerase sigma factor (sigma-70 family)